jgi:ribosome biogenesis protein Nip4
MTKLISGFAGRFGASLSFDERLMVRKQSRIFLLNNKLKDTGLRDFYYAGVYLGKVRGSVFFPSFPLLAMIGGRGANSVVVDDRTEWLFVCGRDIFKQGITAVSGSRKKGAHTLVLSRHGECLGFGRILCNLDVEEDGRKDVVKNVSDVGDFLRRERKRRSL